MTDKTSSWRTIFGDLTTDGVYEMGEVNIYKLTAHLEELYLLIEELKERINVLEKQQSRIMTQKEQYND